MRLQVGRGLFIRTNELNCRRAYHKLLGLLLLEVGGSLLIVPSEQARGEVDRGVCVQLRATRDIGKRWVTV